MTNKEITQNLLNQNTNSVTLSNLMTNPSTNYGLTKESTLFPKLTTLTNQRVTSSTLTVSDLIPLADQSTSLGLSRNTTLVLDPPVNYGDITITQSGQYLPSDFNSQGLYDPTHSAGFEYINQINVNVSQKIEITGIILHGSQNIQPFAPNTVSPAGPFILNNTGSDYSVTVPSSSLLILLSFNSTNNYLLIAMYYKSSSSTKSVPSGCYYYITSTTNNPTVYLTKEQTNERVISLTDSNNDNYQQDYFLYFNAFNFPLFNN